MIGNRSIPPVTVIPVLSYDDVRTAAAWLCDAFGFAERLRIGDHRIQLTVGDGAVVVAARQAGPAGAEAGPAVAAAAPTPFGHVMVRVEDAEGHHARARERGARILQPPTDFPYGERQYRAEDPGGHHWVFSQSIADVDPKDWGGTLVSG